MWYHSIVLVLAFNMCVCVCVCVWGLPCGSSCNAGASGDADAIPGSGSSPGGGNASPLQYSCLENPMDRGAWLTTVYRVGHNYTTEHKCTCACLITPVFVTLWTVAHQAPLSMGVSRQEHWSGLPCPPPRGLPDPGVESAFLTSPALAGGFFTTNTT